jgi:tetratricopeptide (TPR) repeat protein
MRRFFSLALLLALPASPLLAQHDHAAAPVAAGAVPLFDDLGSHHHEITTKSPEAQRYFDQGLRLIYGFNHDEAERAFREAARLDPTCAMAWWGVAFALGPNYNLPIDPDRSNKAVEAVAKAQAQTGRVSQREKDYVVAIATRYVADPPADRAPLDRAFSRAMGDLAARYPDDLDAATLYAESMMDLRPWQLWNPDGSPAPGTEEILATLESVLKRDPNHPGANHYYIHATEASPDPGRGLASAERLKTLVPGAGHLVHMPAHTYMRTGDYIGAAQANAIGARVDEAYFEKSGGPRGVYVPMYYAHNYHFLAAAAAMAGQHEVARGAGRRLVEIAAPLVKDMPMAEFMIPTPLYVALRFQRWGEVLGFPEPDPAFVATRALWRQARGVARAARHDLAGADEERRAFVALRATVPEDAMFNLTPSRQVLAVAALVLDARLASARGDGTAAIEAWKSAILAEDLLPYDEPPIWPFPAREALGGELLRQGRPQEAAEFFRQDLARNPKNGRSLFGLWRSLEATRSTTDAAAARRDFETAWRSAEVPLRVEDL